MNYILSYLLMATATFSVSLWSFLYFNYKNKFNDIVSEIDAEKFMLSELFFIGFGFLRLCRINLKTGRGVKKENKIAQLYGEKQAFFYRYCILGAQVTYALTIIPIGLGAGAMTNDVMFTLLIFAAGAFIITYPDMQINSAVEKRHEDILADYPVMLSKLTLLVNAGLVIREAWNRIAYTSDGALYKEMRITSEEMKNGIPDTEALYNFARRCSVKEIRKFSSVLSQNIQKGGTELTVSLRYMTNESWAERKCRAKVKGEMAGAKLMVPLMIMFIGILIMIIVPLFTNMF